MGIFRRRREPPGRPPRRGAAAAELEQGWNGLSWGATIPQFWTRFPNGGQSDGGWWVTGEGPESFCGVVMDAQYAFNTSDQLYMVCFYPKVADRERLSPAVLNTLGAPDGTATLWTIGDVVVEVKVAGVLAAMTHRRFATG
jgi:hypothetical protein